MKLVKIAKMTLAAGLMLASLLGQPIAALADDVVVDGKIITAENYDASSDPEWKYVPVRRTASTTSAFDGRLLTAADLTTEQTNHADTSP